MSANWREIFLLVIVALLSTANYTSIPRKGVDPDGAGREKKMSRSQSTNNMTVGKMSTMHQANFDDINIFHTFFSGLDLFDSRIADRILNVAAFIYTQDLRNGNNAFIFWVHTLDVKDYCERNTILGDMARYGVRIRVFDWDEEVHGTVIGNDTFYGKFEPNVRAILEKQPAVYSDLVRLMVCGNYGGVWLDGDTWVIRSFTDIFETEDEFAPRFLPSGHFNTHVMRLIKGSPVALRFYKSLLLFRYDPSSACSGPKQGSTHSPLCTDMEGWPTKPSTGLHHFVFNDAHQLHVFNHNADPSAGVYQNKSMNLFDPGWAGLIGPEMGRMLGNSSSELINTSSPYYCIHTRYPKISKVDTASPVGIALSRLHVLTTNRTCYIAGKECFDIGPKHLYALL